MRSLSVVLALAGLFAVSPLSAQVIAYETVEVDADRFVNGGERSLILSYEVTVPVRVEDAGHGQRLAVSGVVEEHFEAQLEPEPQVPALPIPAGIAAYGPFRVLDAGRAALVDVTGPASPAQFAAMLRDYPGIGMIEMIEVPGTEDDLANLRLGRMIRERGIATHVPAGGSVRSGGVELFLAGARRFADPGAEFAVHSWLDDTGREADDYAESAPENRRYIEYYRHMGMSEGRARDFYAMTNSVPFASARWFGAREMGAWVALDSRSVPQVPSVRPEPVLAFAGLWAFAPLPPALR